MSLVAVPVAVAAVALGYYKTREQFRRLRERMSRLEKRVQRVDKNVAVLNQRVDSLRKLVKKGQESQLTPKQLERAITQLQEGQTHLGFLQAMSTALFREYPVFLGAVALDGFTARAVLESVERDRPKVILELGSGSSTLLIATLLERLGMEDTRHIAVEHDEFYLEATRRSLQQQKLNRATELWHCPLEPGAEGEPAWYAGVVERLADVQVDLVIVDGPPGDLHPRSREPALHKLRRHLSARAVVILDDAARDHERAIVEAWKAAYPELKVRVGRKGKGYAEFACLHVRQR